MESYGAGELAATLAFKIREALPEAYRLVDNFLLEKVGVHAVDPRSLRIVYTKKRQRLPAAAAYSRGIIYIYDAQPFLKSPVQALAEEILHASTEFASPGLSERLADCLLYSCKPRMGYSYVYPDYSLLSRFSLDEVAGLARVSFESGAYAASSKLVSQAPTSSPAPGLMILTDGGAVAPSIAIGGAWGEATVVSVVPTQVFAARSGDKPYLIIVDAEPNRLKRGYYLVEGRAKFYILRDGRWETARGLPDSTLLHPAELADGANPLLFEKEEARLAEMLEEDPRLAYEEAVRLAGLFNRDVLPVEYFEHVARRAAALLGAGK